MRRNEDELFRYAHSGVAFTSVKHPGSFFVELRQFMLVHTGDRSVGFEPSRIARRRLASLAATNDRVQEALSPSLFPGLFASENGSYPALRMESRADLPEPGWSPSSTAEYVPASASATWFPQTDVGKPPQALVQHLDELAHDIVSTPGAGGALLAAYAAQARALSMVAEAALRGKDSPLPLSVLEAVQAALVPPAGLSGLALL